MLLIPLLCSYTRRCLLTENVCVHVVHQMALLICKLLTGIYKAVSQFKSRRSILILVCFFSIILTVLCTEKKKLVIQLISWKGNLVPSLSAIVSLSVLNNFELCYRGTVTSWSRGCGNCGGFFAHNYVSEQFGNYVEYGI